MNHILVAGLIIIVVVTYFYLHDRKKPKTEKKNESFDKKLERLNKKYFPDEK